MLNPHVVSINHTRKIVCHNVARKVEIEPLMNDLEFVNLKILTLLV